MTDILLRLDHQLFTLINSKFTSGFLDAVLPVMRSKPTWYPLYALIAVYLAWRYGWHAFILLGLAVITVAVTDQLSSSVIKPIFERTRPCGEPDFLTWGRALIPCSGGFSFVSSHAANHFGIALFTGMLFKKLKWVVWVAVAWAFVVSYSQVYVGVHYPSDILAGGMLGALAGWGAGRAADKFVVRKNEK